MSAAAIAATALDIKERVASVQADREAALAALAARDAVLAATEAERVQLSDATAAALAERDQAIRRYLQRRLPDRGAPANDRKGSPPQPSMESSDTAARAHACARKALANTLGGSAFNLHKL